MNEERREAWDRRHATAGGAPAAADVLRQNRHLLPARGMALDLACGRGGNALLLAAAGLETHAWDLSPVAIGALRAEAAARGLPIQAQVRDVVADPPPPEAFDVIVVSHFLERALAPALIESLRAGGLLFYQTFTREGVGDAGPRNPVYRLAPNELLELFRPLCLRVYREEGLLGDTGRGWRDRAMLVGERRG